MRFLSFTSRRQTTGRDFAFLAANFSAKHKPLQAVRAARRCARRRGVRGAAFYWPVFKAEQLTH